MARRYFIPPDQIEQREPQIVDADAHHLRSVMRVQPGARITVFDGTGAEYRATIVAVSPDAVKVALIAPTGTQSESPLVLTVAQGFLKDKKLDILVRQLTELGVTRFAPFFAKRSIALPDAKRLETRLHRWRRIAREAAKQCGRSRALAIESPVAFVDVLNLAQSSDLRLIFWENGTDAVSMETYRAAHPKDIFLLIGPEGGFEGREVDQAVASGFKVAGMGPRILRAETAALAAGALAQFIFGDMAQKIVDNIGGV